MPYCRKSCHKPSHRQSCSFPCCWKLDGTWETVGDTKNSTGIHKTYKKVVLCTVPLRDGSHDMFVSGFEQYKVLDDGTGHDAVGTATKTDTEYLSGLYVANTRELHLVETKENGIYQGSVDRNGTMTLIFLQSGQKHVVGILKLRKTSPSTEGCIP